jgi:DHA2 family multidrug resistance protein
MFFVGLILLATVALLPPYMQNLMGYSVLDVGILMAPRGIGTMVGMGVVGKLINHVDPRLLILTGLSFTIASLYSMTGFSAFVPAETIVWTGLMQGFGLGLIFVPLSTIAYATLNPKYRAEAASVFNLTRNLGSSIGISIVMVVLSRNIQINHAILVEHITPFTFGVSWKQVPDSLIGVTSGALAMLNGEVNRQAATIAYINDFKLMMWVVLASVPFVLLLKAPKKETGTK